MWKTKFPSHKQHIFDLLLPKKKKNQKRFLQAKAYYTRYYSIWKETSHKPLEVAITKKSFPSVCTIDATCINECFLLHLITVRHHLLYKFIVTQRIGTTVMLLRSLKQMFWKKSAFCVCYLHNNITGLLIPKAHKTSPKFVFR